MTGSNLPSVIWSPYSLTLASLRGLAETPMLSFSGATVIVLAEIARSRWETFAETLADRTER